MTGKINTQPNTLPNVQLFERHILPLPSCCPVSGNPQSGSQIIVSYNPKSSFLEVYSLKKYIDSYIGGHESGIRDMEGMIQQIAMDCAETVGVYVRVEAKVKLQLGDELHLVAKARPQK